MFLFRLMTATLDKYCLAKRWTGSTALHNTAIENDTSLEGLRISKSTLERATNAFQYLDVGDGGSDILRRCLGPFLFNKDMTVCVLALASLVATMALGAAFTLTNATSFLGGVSRKARGADECLTRVNLRFTDSFLGGIVWDGLVASFDDLDAPILGGISKEMPLNFFDEDDSSATLFDKGLDLLLGGTGEVVGLVGGDDWASTLFDDEIDLFGEA